MTKGLVSSGNAGPEPAPVVGFRHRRSVRQAMLAALVLGLIISTVQIVSDFARNETRIERLIEQVVEASKGPARTAAFNWDGELPEQIAQGVMSSRGIKRVELKTEADRVLADISRPEDESIGTPGFAAKLLGPDRVSANSLRDPDGKEIGELVIHIDTAWLTGDFLERSGDTVFGTLLLSLSLAALLSLIFYSQPTKPILQTARRIWGLGPQGLETGALAAPRGHQRDELGLLIRAVEGLRGRFADTIGERGQKIAERKAAKATRRQSEQCFQDFADSASDWLYEAGPNCRLTYFSERMREVTRMEPSSALGLRFKDLPSANHETSDHYEVLEALRAHRSYRGLVYHRRLEDGSIRCFESSGKPIFDDDGKFCGYRGTTTDVTEKVRSQAALAAAQETLLRNTRLAALGELIATVAHELRNPLGAVASSAYVIRRKCRTVINVVDNAREAIIGEEDEDEKAAGGRLLIKTRAGADRLEIRVGDNGPGIPRDHLEKIMEPPFSTKAFGTGLGLPTVQRIMEEHGGGVEIDSEEGRGTNVTLWLRLNDHADQRLLQ